MEFDWLWKSLIARAVWAALFGGSMIGWLKQKSSLLTAPVLYGTAGGVAILVGFLAIGILQQLPEQITPDNVQAHIRTWLDSFHLSVKENESLPEAYFSYRVMPQSGNLLGIGRFRERPTYIMIVGKADAAPEQKAALAKLTPKDKDLIISALILSISASHIAFTTLDPSGGDVPMESLLFQVGIPISNSLTEDLFVQRMSEVDSVLSVYKATLAAELRKRQPE